MLTVKNYLISILLSLQLKATEGFKCLFNTEMGYRVIEYPYEYDGKRYIGYVLVKPYRMFGIYGYDRVTHFTDINSLNTFIGDDLIIDSYGWIKRKINLVD